MLFISNVCCLMFQNVVSIMLFTILLTPFYTKDYCFESNLRLVLLKKVFITKKACSVVLKSSKDDAFS